MASRKTHPHHQWARVGALTRLREIEAERAAIFAAFPDLRRGAGAAVAVAAATGRRRTISPEGRKAMSAGMRRYWARRRAAEKKG